MMFRALMRIAVATYAVAFGSFVHAADDWLDEMPTVERVALVAQADFPGAMTQDQLATHVATILILLRKVMAYQAANEPDMSQERRAKLATIDATYQRVELAIGLGIGKRSGAPSPQEVQKVYQGRRYEACELTACYDYWIKDYLDWWGAHKLRERLLPMLFPCTRAHELVALVTERVMAEPVLVTPVLTRTLPPAVAAVPVSMPAEQCNLSLGRDVDGDGKCFEWESRLFDMEPGEKIESNCAPLVLNAATTNDAESITVNYTLSADFNKQPIRFEVCRAKASYVTACSEPDTEPLGVETVSEPKLLVPGTHDATILEGRKLMPSTAKPYVVVTAKYLERDTYTYFKKNLIGIVLHGYAFDRAVAAGASLDDLLSIEFFDMAIRDIELDNNQLDTWQYDMEFALERRACYDTETFPFFWEFDSVIELDSIITARARELYTRVVAEVAAMKKQHRGDVVDLHFIGHSRGAVVISLMLNEWKLALEKPKERPDPGLAGGYLKLTLLDPHPATQKMEPQESVLVNAMEDFCYLAYKKIQTLIDDPLVELPPNIGIDDVDVFYQQSSYADIKAQHVVPTDSDLACPLNLWGQGGTKDNIVANGVPVERHSLTGAKLKNGDVIDHPSVVDFYVGLINQGNEPCALPPDMPR